MALEALERGRLSQAFLLAEAATLLPEVPLERLPSLSLDRAAEEAALLLSALPHRPSPDPIRVRRMAAGVWALLHGGWARGHLERTPDYFLPYLARMAERDLRLLRTYLREGVRLWGEFSPGGLVLPPHFYRGLEDLIPVWGELALARGQV